MNSKIKVAITGHRPDKLGNDYDLKSPLIDKIHLAILDTLESIDKDLNILPIIGMALGIDTLYALIAIELNLPFIAAVPCLNQESKWIEKSRKIYREIVNNSLCTIHYITNQEYTQSCMQKRNEWMVDNCDILIAVWDGTSGGTANCVRYAENESKIIHRINPRLLR